MSRLSSARESIEEDYDVVVVGSGYGGAIAASRLARAGAQGLRARARRGAPAGRLPRQRALEMLERCSRRQAFGHAGSRTGLYDFHVNDDLNVFVGCGLGGTSLINANVSLPPDARVCDDPAGRRRCVADVPTRLAQGYARAEQMLRADAIPDGRCRDCRSSQALEQSARAIDGGADFSARRSTSRSQDGVNHVGVEQPACTLCGDCVAGLQHRRQEHRC